MYVGMVILCHATLCYVMSHCVMIYHNTYIIVLIPDRYDNMVHGIIV